jgi:hypothetical protein
MILPAPYKTLTRTIAIVQQITDSPSPEYSPGFLVTLIDSASCNLSTGIVPHEYLSR